MSFAEDFVNYLNESWTAFHAVEGAKRLLREHGFVELDERESWGTLEKQASCSRRKSGSPVLTRESRPQGKYFFTRNMSSLVAFCVGGEAAEDSGILLVGAHTDSPCPKLKPISKCSRHHCSMVSVAGYGGGLWHTWFDRDLSVAGRALVKDGSKKIAHRLVKIEEPIMRVPTLAIHLTKGDERSSFCPNLQQHFVPMLATAVKESALLKATKSDAAGGKHNPLLLSLLAERLGCEADEILDIDLQICDTQPSAIGGAAKEFIYSGRLDNLCSSYQALRALVDTLDSLPSEPNVRAIVLFDNEEVGSSSIAGAAGSILPDAIRRIAQGLYGSQRELPADLVPRVCRKSFCVSADMAHAHHPNYPERHDPNLVPRIHGGVVIKHNQNQRYATNGVTATLFRECCQGKEVPVRIPVPFQEFAVRSDSGCGSTIGPITAALTGIRTVDIGSPQLSMHSAREMMGTDDADHGYNALRAFFHNFSSVDSTLEVDCVDGGARSTGIGAPTENHVIVDSMSYDSQASSSTGRNKRKRRKTQ